jgi:hypothetical protein
MGVVAAVAGMAIGGATLATADKESHRTTFTLTSKSLSEQDIDLGKKGFGAGDRNVFRDAVFNEAGKRVATLHGECVFTRVDLKNETASLRCGVTIAFGPHSQIDVAGAFTFSAARADQPFWAVITGGSGRYIGAEGEVRISETGPTTTELRVTLVAD